MPKKVTRASLRSGAVSERVSEKKSEKKTEKKTEKSAKKSASASEVVDYKEKYKNKKRKEAPTASPAQKKTKENPRAPKEFTCPYCEVSITGWVVCRHHIFAKHGVVATRAELLNNTLPPAKIMEDASEGVSEEDEASDEEEELPRGLQDFSEEDSDVEEEEEASGADEEEDEDEDGWIANAKQFWIRFLQNIEDESERKVSTKEIFDKNSKKKFRPEFMSKKEYVRHVIEAMKEDKAFVFDDESSSFSLGEVEESEEDEEEEEEEGKEEENSDNNDDVEDEEEVVASEDEEDGDSSSEE
jgi:hypothetical protein